MSAKRRTAEWSAVERAATAAARERRLAQLRPGWWVFTDGPYGGEWGKVTATARHLDPQTGRVVIALTVRDTLTGVDAVIEAAPGYPAWCLTSVVARQVGLR